MPTQIKPIHLFADSQLLFWKERNVLFLDSIRALLTTDRPKAAYIGASNGDVPDYFELFVAAMEQIGITDCRMIRSSYSGQDASFLEQADLILLAGGDIKAGWRTIDETGMSRAILARYRAGAVLIGTSAGAVQLGTFGYKEYGPSVCELFETLKLVPFMVDTHDGGNYWSRLTENIEQLDNCVMGIGIPAGGGLILHPDGALEPIRSLVDLFVVEGGRIKQSILAPSRAFPNSKAASEAGPVIELLEKVSLTQFFASDTVFRVDRCA